MKTRLEALSNITTVNVTKNFAAGVQTWNVTFVDALPAPSRPQDVPIMEANGTGPTVGHPGPRQHLVAPVLDSDAIAEVQRIQHSGAGGSFWLYFDAAPTSFSAASGHFSAGDVGKHITVARSTT